MELIGTELGKVIVLFQGEEIRPRHGSHQKTVIGSVAEHYNFSIDPDQIISAVMKGDEGPGVVLKDGRFNHEKSTISISELGVYADGITVTASNTEDADLFIEDLLDFVVEKFEYKRFTRVPARLYVSNVVVKFDHELRGLTQVTNGIANAIQGAVSNLIDMPTLPAPILTKVAFAWDSRAIALPFGNGEFVLERRAAVPFRDGHFFSRAPLKTSEHLGVLESIETQLRLDS